MTAPESSIVFDRAATFYDQTRGFPPGVDLAAAECMARTAGVTRASTLVEIGVGTGRLALPLAQHSGTYLGVDLSPSMLQVLVSKQSAYPDGQVYPICGDVLNLPVASASVDFAVLVHILHLVPDPYAAVNELARVIKPGGAAIVGWNRSKMVDLQPLYDAWEQATGDLVRFDEIDAGPQTLAAAGWALRVQDVLTYSAWTTAHDRAELFRQRVYSSMWRLPDDVWAAGVVAIEVALLKHYPDPHAPQRIDHSFYVAVYDRP